MAAFYTLAQLRERLAGSLNVSLVFIDALNELGERAYTISRWPYSSVQFRVAATSIYQNTDSGGEFEDKWFLDIDAETYDGAVRFRVNGTGYEVKGLAEDYADYPRGWNGFIDHGEKVDSAGAAELRVYKCPSGVTNTSNVQCWAKKRWIDLYLDADKYPIRSIAAVKAGLKAISYDENDEIEKAAKKWEEFERLLIGDERQYHGPKKAHIGFRSSLRRQPRSFR